MQTILIVDDDEQLRAMLKLILIESGYAVLEANSGWDVTAIYKQHRPDLVITDLLMPDKEGLEVIRDLQRGYPGARIIAMSGGGIISAESYLVTARNLGARRTLKKPFTQEEFLEAIRLELESEN